MERMCFSEIVMLVDPYGNIIAEGGETEGPVLRRLDLSQIENARAQMTCLDDRPLERVQI